MKNILDMLLCILWYIQCCQRCVHLIFLVREFCILFLVVDEQYFYFQ